MAKEVTIIKDIGWNEYRVPGTDPKNKNQIFYTDDKEDAILTAQAVHGKNVKIKFRTVRG